MPFRGFKNRFAAPSAGRHGGLSLTEFFLFWQGIVVGLVVAGLCYAALLTVRLILGGEEASMLLSPHAHFGTLEASTVFWICLSAVLSLFAGGYVIGRLSGSFLGRTARFEGLVMAGLFFLLLSIPARQYPPQRSTGFSALVKEVQMSSDLSTWPMVQDPIRRAFPQSDFTYSYDAGIRLLSWDLIRGNQPLAILDASQLTKLSAREAERRLDVILPEFQRTFQGAQADARRALIGVGFVLFGTLLLGGGFGVLGAEWGMRTSLAEDRGRRGRDERRRAVA